MPNIYFVDDEPAIRDSVQQAMLIEGVMITCFPNAVEALQCIDTSQAGIVITDIHMPVMTGIEFTQQLLEKNAHFQVIVLTGHGDIQTAVSAMKAGAYDFLEKPFAIDKLKTAIQKATDKLDLVQENVLLRKDLDMQTHVGPKLLGQSQSMVKLRRDLVALNPTQDNFILLVGDTGTGKRITAQYLHDLHHPYDSELFALAAHELPANDAVEFKQFISHTLSKPQVGTLYLYQADILTAQQWTWLTDLKLECNECATSVIIAIHTPPTTFHSEFRRFDLLPLCERKEDIRILFKHFARSAASRYQLPPPTITEEEIQQLTNKPWSENIKQLRQHAELRALKPSDLSSLNCLDSGEQKSLNQRIDLFEQTLLIEVLHRYHGRLKDVQLELQVSRKTLYDKLKKHQLDKTNFKNG